MFCALHFCVVDSHFLLLLAVDAFKMMITTDMLLLIFTFVYTGKREGVGE